MVLVCLVRRNIWSSVGVARMMMLWIVFRRRTLVRKFVGRSLTVGFTLARICAMKGTVKIARRHLNYKRHAHVERTQLKC